ncbi:MAG: hypothetical protein JRG96_12980 [Deltaproteobacteria bacterium]|nr:hypothetical protein [Deltaproteobacteria bacterium]MBW2417485.1 hypothetical protein [Deltaproteobacteria bacterium]
MRTQGLNLEQAPPLSIPVSFFLTAPVSAATAGLLLAAIGPEAITSSWLPITLTLTHLGTLGFLSMVMMGALYQMTPVVAGSPVRRVRAAHAVHAGFASGVAGLCWGMATGAPSVVFVAIAVIFFSLLFFIGPVGLALLRAPTRNETVVGMTGALAALFLTAVAGLWMAHGHSGMHFPGPRDLWIQVHLCIGLLGWVGGLISAVSWQVLPMFYLAGPIDRRWQRSTLGLTALGVLAPTLILGLDYAGQLTAVQTQVKGAAALAALPAVVAIWGLHPLLALRSLAQRRRRRVDGSLLFWRAGLAMAPLTGLCAVAAYLWTDPHWGLLMGWLALWGWAGMIVHGMLTRIVPFLVWFHRFAPLVGRIAVPSVKGLLPDRWTRISFVLHLSTVVAGAAAILSRNAILTRLTGLLLLATAVSLGAALIHVLLQRPTPPEKS